MAITTQIQTPDVPTTLRLAAEPEHEGDVEAVSDERTHEAAGATSAGPSRLTLGVAIFVVAILATFGFTMASAFLMPGVSTLAAFGFGLYCAFWIGIGFGTIFASAAMFGRHAH